MKPIIVMASDHAGFPVKEFVKKQLQEAGYTVEDYGTHSTESVDTAPYAFRVGEEVAAHPDEKKGILVCGTGLGMSIAANKVKGVRAPLVHDLFSAKMTIEHNHANVLCMGARVIAPNMAWEITKVFLTTKPLFGGKYERRVQQITDYDNKRG